MCLKGNLREPRAVPQLNAYSGVFRLRRFEVGTHSAKIPKAPTPEASGTHSLPFSNTGRIDFPGLFRPFAGIASYCMEFFCLPFTFDTVARMSVAFQTTSCPVSLKRRTGTYTCEPISFGAYAVERLSTVIVTLFPARSAEAIFMIAMLLIRSVEFEPAGEPV